MCEINLIKNKEKINSIEAILKKIGSYLKEFKSFFTLKKAKSSKNK